MSSVTSPRPGNDQEPYEALGQEVAVEVNPSVDIQSNDGSEEGELKEGPSVSTKRERSSNVTSPRTGNDQEPEALGQDMTVGVTPSVDIMSGDGSDKGKIRGEPSVGTKRERLPSGEEQPPAKRTKADPALTGCAFGNMVHPIKPVPCVISVNGRAPIGTPYQENQGFAIMLFIDPGRRGFPVVRLGFRNHGTEKKGDHASAEWDTLSNDRGQWAMSEIDHGYCPVNGIDPRKSNTAVHALCKGRDIGQLLYLGFTSWTQTRGYNQKDKFGTEARKTRETMNRIFRPDKPYRLELWFIAPLMAGKLGAGKLNQHCLRFFAESERERVHPFHQWTDINGENFNDTVKQDLPTDILVKGKGKTMFRPTMMTIPEQPAETTVPASQHADGDQDTISGGDTVSSKVEQCTAELSLAAPYLEDSTSTAARDARTSDRPPSPSTETRWSPGRQLMRTFASEPPLPPAQGQQSSILDRLRAFPKVAPALLSGLSDSEQEDEEMQEGQAQGDGGVA